MAARAGAALLLLFVALAAADGERLRALQGPPAGWTCFASEWDDGICDCKVVCGVDDVSCDAAGLENCRALEDLGENFDDTFNDAKDTVNTAFAWATGIIIAIIVASIVVPICICIAVYYLCIKESESTKQQRMMMMQQMYANNAGNRQPQHQNTGVQYVVETPASLPSNAVPTAQFVEAESK